MAWPTDDLTTTDFESASTAGAPSRARAMLYRLIRRTKSIIAARGAANGVCDLNATGKVPTARISRGVAGGVASLGSNGKVVPGQLDGLLMSQGERSKLAGIEAGATADQTAAQIVALLDAHLGGTVWRTPALWSVQAGYESPTARYHRVVFSPTYARNPRIITQALQEGRTATNPRTARAMDVYDISSQGFRVVQGDTGVPEPFFWVSWL